MVTPSCNRGWEIQSQGRHLVLRTLASQIRVPDTGTALPTCNGKQSFISKIPWESSIMVWKVRPQLGTSVSHIGTNSIPGRSTSDATPCQWPMKVMGDDPSLWAIAHMSEHQMKILDPGFSLGQPHLL